MFIGNTTTCHDVINERKINKNWQFNTINKEASVRALLVRSRTVTTRSILTAPTTPRWSKWFSLTATTVRPPRQGYPVSPRPPTELHRPFSSTSIFQRLNRPTVLHELQLTSNIYILGQLSPMPPRTRPVTWPVTWPTAAKTAPPTQPTPTTCYLHMTLRAYCWSFKGWLLHLLYAHSKKF